MRPTPRLLPLLAAAAGAAFVVLVAWATVSGPVGVPHATHATAHARAERQHQPPNPARTADATTRRYHGTPHRSPSLHVGPWLLGGVLALVLVLVLLRTVPRVVAAWGRRSRRERARAPGSPAPLVPVPAEEVAQAVAADLAQQVAALEHGTPRNGIVAAWQRLEEVTAASGVPREPWETSAEFTVRLLKQLDVDPRSAGRLAELYRAARFSSHELAEAERDQAREALTSLQAELQPS